MDLDFSVMRKDLLENGIVCVFGEINQEMADYVVKSILWLNRNANNGENNNKNITLCISSNGGSVMSALIIYDMVFSSRLPVTGVVCNKAYSSAAVILQACHERHIMKNAEIMYHPTKIDISLSDMEGDLDVLLMKVKDRQKAINRIIAARMDRTVEEAWEYIKLEMYLTAEEALDRGLVDHIIETTPDYLPYFKEQFFKRDNKLTI